MLRVYLNLKSNKTLRFLVKSVLLVNLNQYVQLIVTCHFSHHSFAFCIPPFRPDWGKEKEKGHWKVQRVRGVCLHETEAWRTSQVHQRRRGPSSWSFLRGIQLSASQDASSDFSFTWGHLERHKSTVACPARNGWRHAENASDWWRLDQSFQDGNKHVRVCCQRC